MNKIFSELEGFVIYEPTLLKKYIESNNLSNDLLSYLTESEHGDVVTKEGIMIPIMGVPPDYYEFELVQENPSSFLIESKGWIMNVTNEMIKIIGIGYLKDVTTINDSNSLSFSLHNGWQELSILSFEDDENESLGFGLKFSKVDNKPDFYGDMETDYGFK